MICPNCKSKVPDDSIFCTECGTQIVTPNAMSVQNSSGPVQQVSKPERARSTGPNYVVLQVVLKEKLIGTGSGVASLESLQKVINDQAAKGYRLHTITTTSSGSVGLMGGDRIQATMVFEKLDY